MQIGSQIENASDLGEALDPFGETTPAAFSSPGSGWLGTKQRHSSGSENLIFMGERIYAPSIGRFLQTDPIPGGSANAYDYCYQDSVNCYDLQGTIGFPGPPGKNGCYVTDPNCHSTGSSWFAAMAGFIKKHQKVLQEFNVAMAGILLTAVFCGAVAEIGCALVVGAAWGTAAGFADQKSNHPNQSLGQDTLKAVCGDSGGALEVFGENWFPAWLRAAFGWVR